MLPWPVRFAVGVLSSLVACPFATRMQSTVPAPPRPALELTLRPRLAVVSPRDSVRVRAVLRVYDPTPEMRCAAMVWEWGDFERSGHSEDCIPEELEPWYPGVPMVVSAEHVYHTTGTFAVLAQLCGSVTAAGECWDHIASGAGMLTVREAGGEVE